MKERCRQQKKRLIRVKHRMLVWLTQKAVGHNQKSRIQAADQGMMHMMMMQISDPYTMKSRWLSRSGNDAHDDDADIRPIYDEKSMAEVKTTAEIDVFAIGQQHTEQPKFNNEGKVIQNAEEYHDTWKPMSQPLRNQSVVRQPTTFKSEQPRISKPRWKSTCKIFKTVGLKWVPTRKIFTSSTTKVNSEPLNGSNADITNQYECDQTLDVSAETRASRNFHLMYKSMTFDHNSSKLGLHDHSNEQSSSKLVPDVVPPADKTAPTRQALELIFHHHITMLRSIPMTKEQDKQQQQNLLNVELVPINEQVKIATSNFRITLKKTQPDVIYKAAMLTLLVLFRKNSSTRLSRQKQELMPFLRFSKLIIKYILSKHDKISKRPLSFYLVIKLDLTLWNLKFVNKGSKEPIFEMAIPVLMLNDDIKAYAEYSEYLAKSRGVTQVKIRCKGLLTKQGVKNFVERVSIPRMRRSNTVTEEVGQSKEIDDDKVDSEETGEDEEPLVRTRPNGITIGGEAHKEFREESVDHSKKLKGLETLSNKGAGVTLDVPDESSDYSSSSNSDCKFAVEEISSVEAEVTEKANNVTIVDVKKGTKDSVKPEVQSMVDILVTQEKPAELRPSLYTTRLLHVGILIPISLEVSLESTQERIASSEEAMKASKRRVKMDYRLLMQTI
uniref:Uncharacterized protein n=1 Tax=Tanacetum cinerariifolium TaxID=118510 RepID=A0A6L2K5Z9_TANCI|nr:hypothetical protein [Tanacetum cinerariifolium]